MDTLSAMTMISAYAARGAGQTLESFSYDPGELGADEVRIKVTHCGICHSDVSLIDDEHGMASFPVVAGHEVVGEVTAVGARVRHLAVGQRVGVGPLRDACLRCDLCARGLDNLCPERQFTILGHFGGFADAAQVPAAFAFPIPDALTSAAAAPLLCAGLTVYAPLARLSEPGDHVGIMGIGGLGHLAIQIAHRRGSQVTVLSTSPGKEEEARRFGAHHFINVREPQALKEAAGTLDLLLSTTYANVKWSEYMPLLRPNGHLCNVGASMAVLDVPLGLLTLSQTSVSGSSAGSRADMQAMLAFCARHQVAPQVQSMPLSDINAALDRVRERKARYRIVVEVAASGSSH